IPETTPKPEPEPTPELIPEPEPEPVIEQLKCGRGTELVNGICASITCPDGFSLKDGLCIQDSGNGGGCLIATATYGSELAPQVQQLRELRDNQLLQTELGSTFMTGFNDFYYTFSPIIADYERENPVFKEMVKIIITPMISSLSILNHVSIDSEAEVLGFGISLIILNIGMYVGIPASIIVGIRRI
ncbi:MAG: CFI-box-CTERM domain-containing protein, partial [Nitrosopumilus sp.]